MPGKAKIFVASSSDTRSVAYAMQENLEQDAEVTVWDQNTIGLSSYTLEALIQRVGESDFAVCVCAPSDHAVIKDDRVDVTRDNVIFELGLFIGRHGRDRCFVVQPRDVDLHLPSDIAGIMTGRYDPNRSDRNLRAALGPACNQIREQIKKVLAQGAERHELDLDVRSLAAICYRKSGDRIELLLTRTTEGRWSFPKGNRYQAETVEQAVRRVSLHEAGASGAVAATPVGTFRSLKGDSNEEQMTMGFLLEVERTEPVAQSFREPTWFEAARAIEALAEGRGFPYAADLRSLVQKAATVIGDAGS
jgi:hypothetical protein